MTVTLDVRSTADPRPRGRGRGRAAKPSTSARATLARSGRRPELPQRHACAARSRSGVDRRAPRRRTARRSSSSNGRRSSSTEPCWSTAPPALDLGRAAELAVPHPEVRALRPRRSTTGPAGPSCRADRRPSTPSRASPAISPPASVRYSGVDAARGARRARHRDRVRQVGAVQQRPAAGRPAHDLDPAARARVGVDVVVGLEAPERQRRRRPAVEPQHRRRRPPRPRRAARGRRPSARPRRGHGRDRRPGASVRSGPGRRQLLLDERAVRRPRPGARRPRPGRPARPRRSSPRRTGRCSPARASSSSALVHLDDGAGDRRVDLGHRLRRLDLGERRVRDHLERRRRAAARRRRHRARPGRSR